MSTDLGMQRLELQTLKPTWLQRRRMRNVTDNKESGGNQKGLHSCTTIWLRCSVIFLFGLPVAMLLSKTQNSFHSQNVSMSWLEVLAFVQTPSLGLALI